MGNVEKERSNTKFLRLKQIVAPHGCVGVSRSHWYFLIKQGRAPSPVKLGRLSLWRAEEVEAFCESLTHNT